MAGSWRALRRRILTPDHSQTKLSTRGFHEKTPEARDLLETVGATFLTGYAHVVEERTVDEAERRMEHIPEQFRGFAYEGAGMGAAMLDGLPFGSGRKVADLLAGRGRNHSYMVYVGVGWAMARLPRFRWAAAVSAPDPLLRWLALDGYGFHQAYFKTRRYVHEHYREPNFPWPAGGPAGYANHAIDQGIGRALWFVGGTAPAVVADLVDAFPESRRPDLYSGVGLAATYAGGGDESELRVLWQRAAKYRPQLAQGAAFAATARVEAGLTTAHTELAARFFCDLTPKQAAELCDRSRPVPVVDGAVPGYELWRRRVAEQLVEQRGVVA
ncbi:DUF1702 family protein [Kitasatospora kifunensis]|uniref:Enediyne biosynthesis protein n=1 Tax=Kitasatospora kifunensis TaxID=58351 RepID=A0A7W7QZN3_KITKI|nr:DUF1702 family protein [Kitasatospora kifunensis]MBB4922459.1 hypothetical protein [Kitasatospora kifunensis]